MFHETRSCEICPPPPSKTRKILLAISQQGASSRIELTGAIRYAADKRDWEIVKITPISYDLIDNLKHILREQKIDGLIAEDLTFSRIKPFIRKNKAPKIVTIDSNPDNLADAAVFIDNQEIAYAAADFLIRRGFYNFAYVRGNHEYNQYSATIHSSAREKHFLKRIKDAQLAAVAINDDDNLLQAIKQLPKPIGIFAYNDDTANNILKACHSLKLKVPEQLSIIGVDNDVVICENVYPTITSIQPSFEMAGYRAAQLLDQVMSGKRGDINNTYGMLRLIERNSTRDLLGTGRIVSAAQKIIRQRFRENLTSDAIAAELKVSTRLLQMRFKRIAERGIHQEIVRLRLEAAAEMLRTSDHTAMEISEMCGFKWFEHFCRTFRRHYGMSPHSYREHCRAGIAFHGGCRRG